MSERVFGGADRYGPPADSTLTSEPDASGELTLHQGRELVLIGFAEVRHSLEHLDDARRAVALATAKRHIRARFIGLSPITLVRTTAALKPRRSDPDIVRYTTLSTLR